jgi:P-type conjugative transfer protein TrbJ
MNRRLFLVGLAGATGATTITLPGLLLPQPALAQLATFDAAQYANMIRSLSNTITSLQQADAMINNQLAYYNQFIANNSLHIKDLWPHILPWLQKLASNSALGAAVPLTASDILARFKKAYPDWNPDQPYTPIYETAATSAKDSIRATMVVLHDQIPELSKEATDLESIVSANITPGKSQADLLRVGNQLSYQQATQTIQLRALIGQQISNESQFYSAMLADRLEERKRPGSAYLNSALVTASARLQAQHASGQ